MTPIVLYVGDDPSTLTLTALSRGKAHVLPAIPPVYKLDKTGVVDLHFSADGMSAILDPIAPGTVTLDITDERGPARPMPGPASDLRHYDGANPAPINPNPALTASEQNARTGSNPVLPATSAAYARGDYYRGAPNSPQYDIRNAIPADIRGDHQRERTWLADQEAQVLKYGDDKPVATGFAHTHYVIEVRAADAHSLHVDVGQPDAANRAEVARIKGAKTPVPGQLGAPLPNDHLRTAAFLAPGNPGPSWEEAASRTDPLQTAPVPPPNRPDPNVVGNVSPGQPYNQTEAERRGPTVQHVPDPAVRDDVTRRQVETGQGGAESNVQTDGRLNR